MTSFRSPRKQADSIARKLSAHGQSRHSSKKLGKAHSLGTTRNYRDSLRLFAEWRSHQGLTTPLNKSSLSEASSYLAERAEAVQQKTLDQDRQALQALLGEKIQRNKSTIESSLRSRRYAADQVERIACKQSLDNALATRIAHASGLRAHELLTLAPAAEVAKSGHRTWSEHRFVGLEGERYTVTGKGGLIREVIIPSHLADQLESRRLASPVRITDRGIYYESRYKIGGGHKWSQSFSAASTKALKWSAGAHGLRHTYAQDRMDSLQQKGANYRTALEIVSQELGHFRPDITEVYLR